MKTHLFLRRVENAARVETGNDSDALISVNVVMMQIGAVAI